MLDGIVDAVAKSSWAYALIVAVCAFDVVLPFLPSEATVIAAGVLASTGRLTLGFVIAAGAVGAFVGDNGSYLAGRYFGVPATRRLFRRRRARERLAWAERTLEEHGAALVLVSRFIPGGRTATTFTAGLVRFHWLRYVGYTALAGVLWGAFAALVGYFGGRTFEQRPWLGLLLALGLAAVIGIGVEGGRRLLRRRAA